jgi:hypothetical protein
MRVQPVIGLAKDAGISYIVLTPPGANQKPAGDIIAITIFSIEVRVFSNLPGRPENSFLQD